MNRMLRQPSRKLRRWGARPRLSGHKMIGISAMRAPICADLMTISSANSIPELRRSRRSYRLRVNPRIPQ
jgi:hypothetical protein